ncbi:hypothetical protein [Pedobacter jamesrossensis]|uniref:Uncharacterized protein n=1 Tax=Pedobacter jamesrossensis TaxID=1908238 RepID=A0ABV8NL05_9SPHI
MKNLTELMLSFPEMEESEKQSTKGGSDDYSGWSWSSGGWGNWTQDGQGTYNGGNLGTGATIRPDGNNTPGGQYGWSPYNGQTNPYSGGGGGSTGGGDGGGSGEGSTGSDSSIASTFKNAFMDIMRDWWNSPTMRTYFPDIVSINLSSSRVLGVGASGTLAINIITRGNPSLSATFTEGVKVGLHADASVNASVGWIIGDVKNASLDGILGRGVEGSLDFEAVGVGGWTSNNGSTGMPTWVGMSIGVGPGEGGSVGVTDTHLLYINGVPLKLD